MAKPIPLADFRGRVVTLYGDLNRNRSTVQKIDQVLAELVECLGPGATTADLTTASIARWSASLGRTRAPWTVIGQMGYLRAACSYAVEEGWLDRPPSWSRLMPRRPRPGRGLHHPREQLGRLLAFLEERARDGGWIDRLLHTATAVAIYTGLRRDELLFLRQSDVLLQQGILLVIPIEERSLKTPESEQPVPIAPELRPILEAHLPWAAERTDPAHPWLFPGPRHRRAWHGGGPGRRPIDRLRQAALSIGIPEITWQSLRRSWATHAETAWGLSDPQIQRVLRHTSPLTSQAHYRAADVANLRSIAERITYRT